MLTFTDRDAVKATLNAYDLDAHLRALLGLRVWELDIDRLQPLAIKLVVIQAGDDPDLINDAAGFPITGETADDAGFDWIEDHGRWFELAYAGRSMRVFVEDDPGTELGIHYLCLAHSSRFCDF